MRKVKSERSERSEMIVIGMNTDWVSCSLNTVRWQGDSRNRGDGEDEDILEGREQRLGSYQIAKISATRGRCFRLSTILIGSTQAEFNVVISSPRILDS